jgi:deoxyribodipyrimidine photolyase-related protein
MDTAVLILPDQLFEEHPALGSGPRQVALLEHRWYFFEHPYHAQRLVLLQAAMSAFAQELRDAGHDVALFRVADGSHLRVWETLQRDGVGHVELVEPHDTPLLRRLRRDARRSDITISLLHSPNFLTPPGWRSEHLATGASHFSMASFYAAQRKRMGLLLNEDGGPAGGTWSLDTQNRKKLPKDHVPPGVRVPRPHPATAETVRDTAKLFPHAPGSVALGRQDASSAFVYPTTRHEARRALDDFLENRLPLFGDYEDAISREHRIVYHSMLTPVLNIGLLTPDEIVSRAMERAEDGDVPLNSLEGFIRQVVGWREFMYGVYLIEGTRMRESNHLRHTRAMPSAFYEGSTGLDPFDDVVERVRQHGWCHHIERLMVLGNLMLLCEIEPRQVFGWFMEHFVDAYDWVMVPNVYGMSQFADGGTMTTKPYVSASAYLRRMSDYPKGPWCEIWDALYWRWVHRHRELLEGIPRARVLVRGLERLAPDRRRRLLRTAEEWLGRLE